MNVELLHSEHIEHPEPCAQDSFETFQLIAVITLVFGETKIPL